VVVAAVLAAVGVSGSFVVQGDRLWPDDELALTGFGTALAISGDGSTAIVGGPQEVEGRGAVWLFTRGESGWQPQGPKLGGSSQARGFGRRVALSGQGDVALISSGALGAAATLVYRRSGGVWSQEFSLPFATAFAISRDGTTVLLGMPSFSGAGEARIYVRSGTTWMQQGAALSAGDGLSEFGETVALSGDGSTAVVATAWDTAPSTTPLHAGTVWTFTRSGASWTRQDAKLFIPGVELFGESLALSGDGSRLVVSGYDDLARRDGAWVYERAGAGWSGGTRLAIAGGDTDVRGWPTLSADGERLLVGLHEGGGSDVVVRVLTRSGGGWTPEGAALGPGGGPVVGNGALLALSDDGAEALVASPGVDPRLFSVTAYSRSGATWSQNGPQLRDVGANGFSRAGTSVAVSADGGTVLVGGPADGSTLNNVAPPGAVWVFARSAAGWKQQATLRGCGIIGLGQSVAIAADGNTALVAGRGGEAACVFTRTGGSWSSGVRLDAADSPGGGSSVALSPDGTVAVLGSPGTGASGQVRLFGRTEFGWTQIGAPLTGSDALTGARFGASVAISGDAATLLVGGPSDDSLRGAVWTFVPTEPGGWVQDGPKLTATGISSSFGSAIGLSNDGLVALIGMSGRSIALAYARSGSDWVQQGAQLQESLPNGARRSGIEFGASIAVDRAATTAIIGAPQGHEAWLFTRSGTTWTPADAALVSAGDFGRSVALTPNGLAAVIGRPSDGETAEGSAWVYVGQPPPGRPTGVVATPGAGHATVSFAAPPDNGAAIDSYTVTASPGGLSAMGSASPIEVAGLTNGQSYTFTVTATNTSGSGPASAPSDAVTPGAVPDPPLGATAVAADGSAIVSFAAPTSDGGRPILYYTVTASPGGASGIGTGSPIQVYGLENGTSYTLTVTATNSVGTGPPSATTDPIVPVEGPRRPHPAPPAAEDRPAPPEAPALTSSRPPRPAH
jgi:hypothetical protein